MLPRVARRDDCACGGDTSSSHRGRRSLGRKGPREAVDSSSLRFLTAAALGGCGEGAGRHRFSLGTGARQAEEKEEEEEEGAEILFLSFLQLLFWLRVFWIFLGDVFFLSHVHEEALKNLYIFPRALCFWQSRQFMVAIGRISHIFYVLFPPYWQVCSQLRAARILTM